MPQFNIPRMREFCGWMCHEVIRNKKVHSGGGGLFCYLSGRMLFPAQLISLGNCWDDVREDELLSKFLYKAYFGKVF